MPGKRFITLLLLVSFLAACTLVPQQTSQPGNTSSQSLIQPASYQHQAGQSNQTKVPEKFTFPSMVKTTELSQPAVDKQQQLNDALQELLKQDDQQSSFNISQAKPKQVEIVRFMAKANNPKHQIKVPETGNYRLILEVGAKHEIVDADATDGEARIRMPAGSFETLLHLQGPWQQSSSLEIEDGLYYVKDTLDSKTGKPPEPGRWHLLGVRPVPVPQDWYSPDGQTFVLQFKAQDVKEFQIAWWREDEEAPFPPGIKKIGKDGGFVELPSLAKLIVPRGALSQDYSIKLSQEMTFELHPDNIHLAPLSAPVKIQPEELAFNDGFYGDIVVYFDAEQIVSGKDPSAVKYLAKDKTAYYGWQSIPRIINPDESGAFQFGYSDYHSLNKLSTVVPVIFRRQLKSFQTSSQPALSPCVPVVYTQNLGYVHVHCDSLISIKDREMIDFSAEKAIEYFSQPSIQPSPMPIGSYQLRSDSESNQPVFRYLVEVVFEQPPPTHNLPTLPDALVYSSNVFNENSFTVYLDINGSVNKAPFFLIDRIQHEVFHLFQAQHNPAKFEEAFNNITTSWPLESSARYMGTKSFESNFDDFKTYVVQNSKIDLIYQSLPYGDSLENGILNLFKTSFYEAPIAFLPGYDPDELKYSFVNIFASIDNRYGTKKLIDICKSHLNNFNFISMDTSIKTLLETIDAQNPSHVFNTLSIDAVFKRYGLGTDLQADVERIEMHTALTPPSVPLVLSSINTPLNPVQTETQRISSLESRIFYITDNNLIDREDVYFYLDSIASNMPGLNTYDKAGRSFLSNVRIIFLDEPDFFNSKPKVLTTPLPGAVVGPEGGNAVSAVYTLGQSLSPENLGLITVGGDEKLFQKIKLPKNKGFKAVLLVNQPYQRVTRELGYYFDYNIKVFTNPIIWDSRMHEKKMMVVTGSGFNSESSLVFEMLQGENDPWKSVSATVENTQEIKNGMKVQHLYAELPKNAKLGGKIYAKSGSVQSNVIDATRVVCDILGDNSEYQITTLKSCD